jgi:hypothetical protein
LPGARYPSPRQRIICVFRIALLPPRGRAPKWAASASSAACLPREWRRSGLLLRSSRPRSDRDSAVATHPPSRPLQGGEGLASPLVNGTRHKPITFHRSAPLRRLRGTGTGLVVRRPLRSVRRRRPIEVRPLRAVAAVAEGAGGIRAAGIAAAGTDDDGRMLE